MAVSGNAQSNANLVAAINEVWSSKINESLFPKAVISNFVADLSEFIADEADIVHVPDLYTNELSVKTQSTPGTEITPSTATSVDDTITVNTHKYVAFMLDDKTMLQVAKNYDLVKAYSRQAQGLLMQALEDAIFANYTSLTNSAVGDTTSGSVTDANIREAISTMEENDFDIQDLAFFFHPEIFWKQLHGISKYYTDDTANLSLHLDGNFGSGDASRALKGALFGIPIFTSTRVPSSLEAYKNLLLHPDAFGFAIKGRGSMMSEFGDAPIKIRTQMSYEHRNLATLASADIIYGTGVLRAEAGVIINGNVNFLNS